MITRDEAIVVSCSDGARACCAGAEGRGRPPTGPPGGRSERAGGERRRTLPERRAQLHLADAAAARRLLFVLEVGRH